MAAVRPLLPSVLALGVLALAGAGLDQAAPAAVSAHRADGSILDFPWNRWFGRASEGSYPLDHHSRTVATEGRLECPEVELVRYRGDVVRYARPTRVAAPFREKLRAFEEVLAEVATAHYGRPPQRILHFGTYYCRRVRGRPYRMSEHSLGNGIDVQGFVFGPAPRAVRGSLPRLLQRRFEVNVVRHWSPRREQDAVHARFLRALTAELARRDVFRAMLGPRHPRHRDHFHFDYGPFRYRIL